MLNGAATIKIHGEYVPVRAQVESIDNLSAHADFAQILEWLGKMQQAPRQVFITHGEPTAAAAMVQHVEETLHWPARVPEYLETVQLGSE